MSGFQLNNVTQGSFRFIYQKYKPFYLPVTVVIASVLLLVVVDLPQFQIYLQRRQDETVLRRKIEVLQKNVVYLANINKAQQERDLTTVVSALPIEKDFTGILTSVSYAAVNTGVSVNDFSFTVGQLDGGDIKTESGALPDTTIQLSLVTSPQSLQHFLQLLSQALPLSDANTISIAENVASVQMVYFYKPLSPEPIKYTVPLRGLTPQQQSTLSTLKQWEKNTNGDVVFTPPTPEATASAEVIPTESTPIVQ